VLAGLSVGAEASFDQAVRIDLPPITPFFKRQFADECAIEQPRSIRLKKYCGASDGFSIRRGCAARYRTDLGD
jgi:hypothetical protein